MYEQFLIHLFSDYWLQNDWMALNKKKHFWIALIHAFIYTLPFLLVTKSLSALFVIFITHAIIDGTNIVNWLNQIKNWNFQDGFQITSSTILGNFVTSPFIRDGFSSTRPDYIRVWLIIIQDNILHLIINYLAIKYL